MLYSVRWNPTRVPSRTRDAGQGTSERDDAGAEVGDAEREVRTRTRHEHQRGGYAEPVRERGDARGRKRAPHQNLATRAHPDGST